MMRTGVQLIRTYYAKAVSTSLRPLLTNAVTNACTWAVAFHTALAQEGVDPADVKAIRECHTPLFLAGTSCLVGYPRAI